ncbi:hypothetical protein OAM97_04575, partial [Flavobacteriaceae bacterium]|nr:hypothetical protein [Flavobacteriaceae bacterium]
DIVSNNEHFLPHMFEILAKPKEMIGNCQFGGGIIDGWKIPFKDYEMKMSGWFIDDSDKLPNWKKIEKQISEILGLKIHQFKNKAMEDKWYDMELIRVMEQFNHI